MIKSPYIGQLDRKIAIKQLSKTQNTTGEEVATLTTVASPWAFMEDKTGSEDVEGKVRHLIERSYIIRYNATIAATGNEMVVTDGTDNYYVYHVNHIGRKKHLQLLVTKYE